MTDAIFLRTYPSVSLVGLVKDLSTAGETFTSAESAAMAGSPSMLSSRGSWYNISEMYSLNGLPSRREQAWN